MFLGFQVYSLLRKRVVKGHTFQNLTLKSKGRNSSLQIIKLFFYLSARFHSIIYFIHWTGKDRKRSN